MGGADEGGHTELSWEAISILHPLARALSQKGGGLKWLRSYSKEWLLDMWGKTVAEELLLLLLLRRQTADL